MFNTNKLTESTNNKTTWSIANSDPMVILRSGEYVRMSQAEAWGECYVLAPVQLGRTR